MKKLLILRSLRKKNGLAYAVGMIIVFLISSIYIYNILFPNKSDAAWFNDNWGYRKAINITGHTSAETNVYISLTLDTQSLITAGKMKSNCGDLRYTDYSGNLLPYYIVSGCNTSSTSIHVFMVNFPAGAQTIYYYYGNFSASNGFSSKDFATAATGVTIGTTGAEEGVAAPVAYWKFDEGVGTVANNSGSQSASYSGTLVSTPTWKTQDQCIVGKCLLFNGSSNYVSVNNAPTINPTTGLTVEAWINVKTVASSTNYNIVAKQDWGNKLGFRLAITGFGCSTNCLFMGVGDGTNQTEAGTGINLNDVNTWHHVTGVYSSGNLYLYLDGNLKYSTTTPVTSIVNTTGILAIARHSSGGEFFPGSIDDVKIYTYARTAAQVKSDFNSSAAANAKGSNSVLGAQNQSNLSNGMVGYWKMDESSWTNDCSTASVLDSSGNSNNGKACPNSTGPTGGATGKFANAGSFDGSNDYVSVAASSTFDTQRPTIAAWVYSSNFSQNGFIFEKTTNGAVNTQYSCFFEGGNIVFRTYNSISTINSLTVASSGLVTNNAWNHIVCTYDGTKKYIYVNGALATSAAYTETLITNPAGTSFIGAYGGGSGYWFNGKIDDLRVYNRAFSSSDVTQLYNFAAPPVAYWNMDEKNGTTINDRSGNGISATLSGGYSWGSGKYGAAPVFNGTDVQISASDNTLLDIHSGSKTWSTWFKTTMTSRGILYRKSDASNANGVLIDIGLSTPGQLRCFVSGPGAPPSVNITASSTTSTWNDGKWHYVSCVLDRDANLLNLYIDGVKDTSADSSTLSTTDLDAGASFLIGQGGCCFFSGGIDDFKIYSYARSAKQVVSDMNADHPAGGSPVGSALGYWKLDEGYGTTLHNSGSQGSIIDGTLSTGVWKQDGKFGKSMYFNDGYMTIGSESTFDFTSDFSISLWINVDPNNSTSYRGILGKYNATASGWDLGIQNGKTRMTLRGTSQIDNTGAGNDLGSNVWHHVVIVNTNSAIYTYDDGVLTNTTTGTWTSTTNNVSLTLGNRAAAGTTGFAGRLDEVKIYNYALTADEVKLDYNNNSGQVLGALSDTSGLTGGSVGSSSASAIYCIPGDTTSCNPPALEYNFEEKTGTTANDSSGNSLSGTWNGSLTSQWNTGKYGGGGKFNGSDNYVLSSNLNSYLNNANPLTVEIWFYPQAAGVIVDELGQTSINTAWHDSWLEVTSNTGTVKARVWSCTSITLGTATMNAWNHAVLTYTSGTVGGYLNGVAATGGSCTRSFPGGGAMYLALGVTDSTNMGSGNYFSGKMDQLRIYTYLRSASQVAWDYSNGKPIAYWKMDECQGTLLHDSTGNNNNLTITVGGGGTHTVAGTCNSPTNGTGLWFAGATGKYNSAFSTDGTDDSSTGSVTGQSTSYVSTSAWIKLNSHVNWNDMVYHNWVGNGWWLGSDVSGLAYFTIAQSGVQFTSGGVAISTGTWYHLVGVYDGANVKLYINGILRASGVKANAVLDAAASSISVGSNNSNMLIDDVKVFNYPLTTSQVKTLYNDGSVRFGPITGTP